MGDLNLDWLSNASDGLKDLCTSLNLSQLISAPTRPDPSILGKSTLLDLILTNRPHNFKSSGVLPLDFSDHCPIACIRDIKQVKSKPCLIVKRNLWTRIFLTDISSLDISFITDISDPTLALNNFIIAYNSVADRHAPFKKLRMKNRCTPGSHKKLLNYCMLGTLLGTRLIPQVQLVIGNIFVIFVINVLYLYVMLNLTIMSHPYTRLFW